jgi:hypothetical protein
MNLKIEAAKVTLNYRITYKRIKMAKSFLRRYENSI